MTNRFKEKGDLQSYEKLKSFARLDKMVVKNDVSRAPQMTHF
jgi:hypothetical protein